MNDYFVQSLHAMASVEKEKEFAKKPIRTLGEVILLLKAQPEKNIVKLDFSECNPCLLYTSPSPRDRTRSRMPSSA